MCPLRVSGRKCFYISASDTHTKWRWARREGYEGGIERAKLGSHQAAKMEVVWKEGTRQRTAAVLKGRLEKA